MQRPCAVLCTRQARKGSPKAAPGNGGSSTVGAQAHAQSQTKAIPSRPTTSNPNSMTQAAAKSACCLATPGKGNAYTQLSTHSQGSSTDGCSTEVTDQQHRRLLNQNNSHTVQHSLSSIQGASDLLLVQSATNSSSNKPNKAKPVDQNCIMSAVLRLSLTSQERSAGS